MDKRQERKTLDYVFGRVGPLDVTECEQPDFICRPNPSLSFGVEVTEFYFSESVARLRRIEGYAEELLKSETYRHKDDKIRIPVRNVIYRSGKIGEEVELKAIAGEGYTAAKVIERFCDLVRAKNAKRETYEKSLATVDLIIHDVDSILGYYSVEDWIRTVHHVGAADCITKSLFREIYVVTQRGQANRVCVPLRANLFVAEVWALQTMFKKFYGDSLQDVTFREYLKTLARYLVDRFDGIECELDDDGRFRFVFASVAVCYGENGTLEVRDISCDSINNRKKLDEELDGVLDAEFGRYVDSKRRGMFCCVPMQFKAYERNANAQ